MRTLRHTLTIGGPLLAALLVFIASTAAQPSSPTLTTLYSFSGPPDGASPEAGVVIGPGGVLDGTTCGGGTSSKGTAFSLTPPA
jgi:hypothetical protein